MEKGSQNLLFLVDVINIWPHNCNFQKQPPEVFWKRRCSSKCRKIHRKTPVPESSLIKLHALPATLLKKRPWQRCFPVTFSKILRTLFLQNTSRRLLLRFLFHLESLRVSDWHKALKLNLSELKKSHKGTLMQIWKRPYIFKIR